MKTWMSKNELRHVPIGVLFIAFFYMFGTLILLVGVSINPSAVCETIARAHGLLPGIGIEIVLFVAALALVLAYGLIRLSHWGYILTVTYSVYICLVNLIMSDLAFTWPIQPEKHITYGNFLFSAFVILYLLIERKHFFGVQPGDRR